MRYRNMRYPADSECRVELNGSVNRARLVDISPSGARLKGLPALQSNSRIIICHTYRRIAAQVIWSNDRYTGVRFSMPLGTQEVNDIRGVVASGGFGSQGNHGFREMT
ncbi:MAG: hypothetical protein ACJASC_003165 [Limimaricola cinnabarinus]|jgi:hypothetical protein|uniref:PilZ domain-containing protein n=1 Tax=Limimaricola cinnabarinus TaxID=1125964 RepID=UPI0039E6BF24